MYHNIYKYIVGFVIGILFMYIPLHFTNTKTEQIIKTDTIHTTYTDTIFVPIEKIKYVESKIIDTIYLKPTDTVLLVEQKEYKDTISTIWISGVEPKIDSISYRIPRDTFFINKEITVKEQRRINKGLTLNIGLGTGIGINPITGKIEPTIGIQGTIGWGLCISKKRVD